VLKCIFSFFSKKKKKRGGGNQQEERGKEVGKTAFFFNI
jgi:hypothetical protein